MSRSIYLRKGRIYMTRQRRKRKRISKSLYIRR